VDTSSEQGKEVGKTDPGGDIPAAARRLFGPGRVRIAMFLLMLSYMLSIIDRRIVEILADPISRELGLSDTQIGLMSGLSFAIFYTALGIPLARFADNPRTNRVTLISICLAVWSCATALGGLAQNFVQMLIARIAVGAGEAGCTPSAASLVADFVAPNRRARAMAFYGLGVPLGTLFGLSMGGLLADVFGWRLAMLMVGAPGLLLAGAILLFIKEPRRDVEGAREHAEALAAQRPGILEVLREISSSRAFMWMLFGNCCSSFLANGKMVFQILYLIRIHQLSPGTVGVDLGIAIGILGLAGTWVGGVIGDHFGSKNPRHYLTIPILGTLISFPVLLIGYTTHNTGLAIVLIAVPQFLNGLGFGPNYATIQGLVRPQARAMAVSLKLLVQVLIGTGLGPLGFGLLSDALKPAAGAHSVQWVLLIGTSLLLVSAFSDWRASLHMNRELKYRD
jgi:predicted MFS family arabinose efflux permease